MFSSSVLSGSNSIKLPWFCFPVFFSGLHPTGAPKKKIIPRGQRVGRGSGSLKSRLHNAVRMLMLLMEMVKQSHDLSMYVVLCQKS